MSEQSNTQPAAEAPAGAPEQPTPPTVAGDKKPVDGQPSDKLFTQAELEKHIDDRLKSERKKLVDATDKARREAEEKSLADNAKWQELAEKRAKDLEAATAALADVDALKSTSEAQAAALGRYLDAERKGLPDHIIGLLDKLPPLQQLEWLAENKTKLSPKPSTDADKRSTSSESATDWTKVAAQKFGIRTP
jgi:hypothetical protein